MNQALLAYVFAFSSVLTFSTAAIAFTYFSKKVSALWMNIFKCLVSLLFSVPVVYFLNGQLWWDWSVAWPFYVSGIIGLNVGDWMLLSAYRIMGPARTLVLFGFQPFITGAYAYFVWGEALLPIQLLAIIFFVLCLFLFSYERFKKSGSWEFKGLLLAFGGVFLDSLGVILTRYGFNENATLTGMEAQYLRTLAASLSFLIYVPFVKISFFKHYQSLNFKQKSLAFLASFAGTFLSLVFYMQALKLGKLATVTSIVLTDPVMSTFFECLWLRTWPSRYLWIALVSFFCAMFCLFYPQLS
jgi:drug/metabolite transporter (DMT)-like permease